MKIVTLRSDQQRIWLKNLPVLVYSDTDEACLDANGKPQHPTADQLRGLLLAAKRGKLFEVEVDETNEKGEPVKRACHFVKGRSFLGRTYARAYNQSVQLRLANGQVLGTHRAKFEGHDFMNSPCPPIERNRPYTPARISASPAAIEAQAVVLANTPAPDQCGECMQWSKPLGARADEHHFICRHHDAWEAIRKARLRDEPKTEPDTTAPDDRIMVIDLNTGAALREASPDEIAEAKIATEETGTPIIKIGDESYAIGDSNFAMMG